MTANITSGFDVENYVEVVRIFLGDLDDPARDGLTEGLTADLKDLVAERGIDALPDPEDYADELRAAAGLPPRSRGNRPPRRLAARSDEALDKILQRTWRAVDSGTSRAAALYAIELRPVWWCVRAQVAFWLWQTAMGGQNAITVTPTGSALDLVVWTVLIILSIGAGRVARGRLSGSTRLWLLAANSGAVLSLPYFIDRLDSILRY